jgi:hypothetical protein
VQQACSERLRLQAQALEQALLLWALLLWALARQAWPEVRRARVPVLPERQVLALAQARALWPPQAGAKRALRLVWWGAAGQSLPGIPR